MTEAATPVSVVCATHFKASTLKQYNFGLCHAWKLNIKCD